MLFVIPKGKITQNFKRSFARSNVVSEGTADRKDKGTIATRSGSGGDSVLVMIDTATHEVWATDCRD